MIPKSGERFLDKIMRAENRVMLKAGVVALGLGATAVVLPLAAQAQTQVRDAIYRGTMVCDKLPFFETAVREGIEVKIKGNAITYTHIVRERGELSFEQGSGTLDGDRIAL